MSPRSHYPRALGRCTWLLACLLVIYGSHVTWAQRAVRRTIGPPSPQAVFLPAPRELRQELTRAMKDLDDEKYVDAIARLNLILSGEGRGEGSEDYFLPPEKQAPLKSLKSEALRLIGQLPPAGREVYELQYGTQARKELDDAIRARNFDAIGYVSRRYFHTLAGYDAAMLLGRDRLERGLPLAAVLEFRRLLNSKLAKQRFGGELPLLQATALVMSGRDTEAKTVLEALRNSAASDSVTVRDQSVSLYRDGDDPLEWLAELTGTLGRSIRKAVDEWLVFGGNAQRSAISAVDMPMQRMQWEAHMTSNIREEQQIDSFAKRIGEAVTPAFHPLAVNDTVLMRTVDGMQAVDFETGRLIWQYPWSEEEADSDDSIDASPFGNRSRRSTLVQERVFKNALYGQMSSDGESVYLLDHVSPSNLTSFGNTNELVRLELKREGYSLWHVGGDVSETEPKLAGIYFLGSPLPIGDEIYVVGEVNGEIRLVVLDKKTGKQVWSQQLAHVEMRNSLIQGTQMQRRLFGVNPCFADGILVCPTMVGGVVAIDVANRAFLWGFQYKQFSPRSRNSQQEILSRWRDNAVMIADGKVIITPLDSEETYCLDLLTGERVWKNDPRRSSSIFLGGIHGDQIILINKNGVSTRDLQTGENGWTLTIQGSPSGRGVQGHAHYFLATNAPELLKIDLETGKIVDRITTDEPLGNLVAYKGAIISQGLRGLRTYAQRGKLRERVGAAFAKNPQDPWALENDGLLLLDEGKLAEGLERLRQAISAYPASDPSGAAEATKELLVDTILAMLRDDEPGSTELAQELESLIDGESARRVELLRLLTVNLLRRGQYREAFQKCLEHLVREASEQKMVFDVGDSQLLKVESHRLVRQDRWHRGIFQAIWQAADNDVRTSLAAMVGEAWDKTPPAQHALLAEAMEDLPPSHLRCLERLEDAISIGSPQPVIEGKLIRFAKSDDDEIAAKSVALLGKLYHDAGRAEAAAHVLQRLQQQFPQQPVWDNKTGAEYAESIIANSPAVREAHTYRPAWPFGKVDVIQTKVASAQTARRTLRSPFNRYSVNRPSRIIPIGQQQPSLVPPYGMDLVLDIATRSLQGRGPAGQIMFDTPLPLQASSNTTYRAHGHLIVASHHDQLVAVNALSPTSTLDERIIWKDLGETELGINRTTSSTTKPISLTMGLTRVIQKPSAGRSIPALGPVSDRGVILRRWNELVSLDAATGEIAWRRDDVAKDAEVWGDDEYVFVHSDEEDQARVFAVLDGHELQSRDVPKLNRRIRTMGRYVLTYRDDDFDAAGREGVRLQLSDLFGTWIWSHTFSEQSIACFVGSNEMAVYDPLLGIKIFSLMTGETVVDQRLELNLKTVTQLEVEHRAGQYIVVLGEKTAGRTTDITYRSPEASRPLINAEVYAFDGETGESRWEVPAKLDNYLLSEFVARELPVLVFMRRIEQSPKRQLETVVLDVRDGHAMFQSVGDADGQEFRVQGDRDTHTIELRVPATDGSWKLRLTNAARPPRPPFGYATETPTEPEENSADR